MVLMACDAVLLTVMMMSISSMWPWWLMKAVIDETAIVWRKTAWHVAWRWRLMTIAALAWYWWRCYCDGIPVALWWWVSGTWLADGVKIATAVWCDLDDITKRHWRDELSVMMMTDVLLMILMVMMGWRTWSIDEACDWRILLMTCIGYWWCVCGVMTAWLPDEWPWRGWTDGGSGGSCSWWWLTMMTNVLLVMMADVVMMKWYCWRLCIIICHCVFVMMMMMTDGGIVLLCDDDIDVAWWWWRYSVMTWYWWWLAWLMMMCGIDDGIVLVLWRSGWPCS
jgi:hypothetical protein